MTSAPKPLEALPAAGDAVLAALERHQLILRLDARGRIRAANEGLGRLLDHPASALVGRPWTFLLHRPVSKPDLKALTRAFASPAGWHGLLALRHRDGSPRWVQATLVPLGHGETLAFGLDASAAQQQATDLRRLSRLYEALSQVGQHIVRATSQDTLFQQICDILVGVAGLKMVWIGLDHPDTHEVSVAAQSGDAGGYLHRIRVRSDDTPEGRGPGGTAIRTGRTGRTCVINDFLHHAASAPWHAQAARAGLASNATFPLRKGDRIIGHLSLYSGEPGYFGSAEVELMEKVGAQLAFALHHLEEEAERAEAEERFTTIVQASPVAISLIDLPSGAFVEVNPAFERTLGYSAAEILGKTGHQLGLWAEPDNRARYLDHLQRERTVKDWETTLRTKSGREIKALYSGELITLKGRMYVLSLFLDVTEARRAEAERSRLEFELLQSQKLEALGRLAGGVAHDLNNVLSAILAHAELMERKLAPDSPLLHHVQQTMAAVDRSHGIVRQLLAFSRKHPAEPKVLDLDAQVTQLLRTLAPLLGEDIHVDWAAPADLPSVTFDPGLLDQVLMNLLVNARDAMPRGGEIHLSARALAAEEAERLPFLKAHDFPHLCLACRDTGIGMDAATLAHIFEPFFTTKAPEKGTGLGLSTVHGIVNQAGGAIQVESALGEGTEFRIYLPVPTGGQATSSLPVAGGEPSLQGLRVLLVEDSETLRDILTEMLRMHGMQVAPAESPERALELFRHLGLGFDLLLTDVVMPGMSGLELFKQLQALQPSLRVVLMSGYAPETLEERFDTPAVQFLRKPFTSPTLLKRLQEAASAPLAGEGPMEAGPGQR